MNKNLYRYFIVSLVCIATAATAQEVINNWSIITLVRAKVARDLVLGKIKANASQFNMSTNGLIELKQATVPDPIVNVLVAGVGRGDDASNQNIIDLCAGGVSRGIITKKIQCSETSFNLLTDDVVALKIAKVSDPLVKVMMVPKRAQQQSTNPNPIADVLPSHQETLPIAARTRFAEPGIYYEEYKTPKPQYLQLEPTTNQTKTSSVGEAVSNQYTGSITDTTKQVGLANRSANTVVNDNYPVFY